MFRPLEKDLQEIVERNYAELFALTGQEVCVTGCAGFLGRYFICLINHFNNLCENKIRVIGVDNLVSSGAFGADFIELESEYFEFVNCDFSKPTDEILTRIANSTHFIHAAGIASPAHYKRLPLETIDIAVNGTRSLLNLAIKTSAKVTFFSSSEIYGNPPAHEIPILETYKGNVSSTGPRACYDESKRLGETLCSVYTNEYGVATSIIRPFNVYGPGMQETDYRVIPNFGFRLKEQQKLQVYGDGNQTRTYCYIVDAMSGFLKVIVGGDTGQAYNVGNPKNEISALKLAQKFKLISKRASKIEVIDHPSNYPADEPERRCPDISRLRNLGYEPVISLDLGLRRFWEYITSDV